MDGVETGTVIASSGTELNKPDQQLVLEEGFMGNHALTVFESFQYDNSVFQIYLVNPGGELNEETKDLTLFYTGYVILLFVLSLLIVLLFTSMFSRRIGMLRDRMHSVASGQFDAKAEISGRDEISELNSDLSVMVDSMRLLMKDAYQAKLQNETFRLDQMEAEIKTYEAQYKTGNQVLDTVLTGKGLYCMQNNISLTCVADGRLLDFMEVMDLSAIFGNALDNAIECVEKIRNPEKRLIHVTVSSQRNFVLIRFENYYEGDLHFSEGLPITTKKDENFHGYGLKSIRYVVGKYDGIATVRTEKQWFVLQILLPDSGSKDSPC